MSAWDKRLLSLLNRDALPAWLTSNFPNGKMVEVGTYYGEFADHVLKGWKGHLMCVDPWEDQPDSVYRDGCANKGVAGGRNPMQPIFVEATKRLRRWGNRVSIHQEFSEDFVLKIPDQSLSCVYIDGNHRFQSAQHDLFAWWNKVHDGGIIGIHDCYIRDDAVQQCGVWDAVWEFARVQQIQPFLTNCSSAWWIKIPF